MKLAEFQARKWVEGHVSEADKLTDATWDSVAALTILWNEFERKFCNKRAKIAVFEGMASGVDPKTLLPGLIAASSVLYGPLRDVIKEVSGD